MQKKIIMVAFLSLVVVVGLFYLFGIYFSKQVQSSPKEFSRTEQDVLTAQQTGFTAGIDSEGIEGAFFLSGWPISTGSNCASRFPPHIQDIDRDGWKEVVFACNQGVFVWDAFGETKQGWPFILSNYPWTFLFSPAITDLNRDLYFEIIGGAERIEQYVLDRFGNFISGWPVNGEYAFSASSVIGDIDGDGELEVVNGHRYPGRVYAWKDDGGIINGWPVPVQGSDYIRTLALADLNKDRKAEILATDSMYVYIWKHDGTNFNSAWPRLLEPWGQQLNTGTYYNNPIAITLADVNQDGKLEIVVYTYNFAYYNDEKRIWVHVIKPDGTELSGFPVEIQGLYGWDNPGTQLVVANLDQDPELEIIVPTLTKLIIVNADGSYFLLPEGNIPGADFIGFRGAAVADIAGDGNMEIISPILMDYDPYSYGEEDGRIYAWNSNGEVIGGFPIVLPWPPSSVLTIEDVDGNRKPELWGAYEVFGEFGGTADAGVYAVELDEDFFFSGIEWGTWGYDNRNTQCYKCQIAQIMRAI